MSHRFAVLMSALAFVLLIHPAQAKSDDSGWDESDTASVKRGTTFFDSGRFSDAEAAYHQVLDRHPNSESALLWDVKGLNGLGQYEQALVENRKAVSLEPDDALGWEYLGMTLALTGQNREAIDALEKSQTLNPNERTTLVWIGGACYQDGQTVRAEQIFDKLMQPTPDECQSCTASRIADFFRQTGHGEKAIAWWKKSYDLGNTDAARFLAWAYGSGAPGFPYDSGEASYWQRRGPDDAYPWFQPVSFADQIDHWAHGWGLVLILLTSAAVVPWLAVGPIAWCFSRGLTRDPAIHWTERARRSYPFYIALLVGTMVPLGFYIGTVEDFPGSLLPVPRWILMWVVFAIVYGMGNVILVRWARLYRDDAGTAWQSMKSTGVVFCIVIPFLVPFLVVGSTLPPQWNLQAALIVTAGILAYFWIQFGGWIRLARLLHLLLPASAELHADAAALAARWKRPRPAVYLLRWRKASAFAFPFSNAIVVSEGLLRILTRAEVSTIMAHELAHLFEDRGTRIMRLLGGLLLLPLCTASLWAPNFWAGAGISFFIVILGILLMQRRSRKMEERADRFGKDSEAEASAYALALAKLYEANLIPAVMAGNRKVHPHLYDRLLAAGVTPDYPRPKAPGSWSIPAAILMVLATLIYLNAIWLCLF